MPRTRKYPMKKRVSRKRTSGTSRRRLQSKTIIPQLNRPVGQVLYNQASRRFDIPSITIDGSEFAAMTRKPRTRTQTVTKSKQGNDGTGGYSQWSQRYATAKFGKLTARKIDKLSNDIVIQRHQLIGPFNDYGQRFMYNATTATGNLYYPLILFELNSVNNYINGTQTFMSPVHQMYQPAGTTNIAWDPLPGQSFDGTAGVTNWITEKSGHTSGAVASHPMEQSIHKWSSLDLELWGQTQKPTMYTIYLCQFNEDVLPETTIVSNVGKYSTITQANACEFWQSMVKRYVYSPLAKIDDGWSRKKIKVLKQYKVNIDPTATYENDPDPHVKTMKLFYRFNRKCNFEWRYSNANPFTIADMNDKDWQQEDGENSVQVHPNARMFVMVRASNFVRGSTDVPTNATMPSISWVMRSCHLINQ